VYPKTPCSPMLRSCAMSELKSYAYNFVCGLVCACCILFAGLKLCKNFMDILSKKEESEVELLIYTMTLINKVSSTYMEYIGVQWDSAVMTCRSMFTFIFYLL
jgi:hypothetical protein